MVFESIIFTKENGIAKIVLNRPESLNAFVGEMRQELAAALDDIDADPAVRAVVITANGRAFSAGGNLKRIAEGFSATRGRDHVLVNERMMFARLMNLEKPVIAGVNGIAVGAGCNIALACDIIIASEEAKFGQVFVRIGLIPDFGGLYTLPRLIGVHRAKELIFSGDIIDAREAERIGMVNRVVPAGELESTIMSMAERFAKGPTRAIGMSKVLLHRMLTSDLDAAIELEAFGQAICWQTEDHKEGVKAFFEKRTPEFKGQ